MNQHLFTYLFTQEGHLYEQVQFYFDKKIDCCICDGGVVVSMVMALMSVLAVEI